jgi:GNAT superfamily N-acetyltransferase
VVLAVRDATDDDARAVAEVHVASWHAAYAGLIPADVLAELSVEERAAMWRRTLRDPAHHLLVLAAPGVVGFASCGPCRTDPDRGELYALYLDPAWWGRGGGRPLHDAALDRLAAAGHRTAALWVLRGNARAIRFYRARGWGPDGAEKLERGPGGAVLPEVRYVRTTRTP